MGRHILPQIFLYFANIFKLETDHTKAQKAQSYSMRCWTLQSRSCIVWKQTAALNILQTYAQACVLKRYIQQHLCTIYVITLTTSPIGYWLLYQDNDVCHRVEKLSQSKEALSVGPHSNSFTWKLFSKDQTKMAHSLDYS